MKKTLFSKEFCALGKQAPCPLLALVFPLVKWDKWFLRSPLALSFFAVSTHPQSP